MTLFIDNKFLITVFKMFKENFENLGSLRSIYKPNVIELVFYVFGLFYKLRTSLGCLHQSFSLFMWSFKNLLSS